MAGYPNPDPIIKGAWFYDLGPYFERAYPNRYLWSKRYKLTVAYHSHSIILLKDGQCRWVKNRSASCRNSFLDDNEMKEFLFQQLKSEYFT